MREHVSPANLVTSVGLGTGFGALLVTRDSVAFAAALVGVAASLDGVDGMLARRRGGDRAFGGQLDSLSDIVCFGVVPAATLWWAVLQPLSALGLLASGVVVVAGAWRLARFHLVQAPGRYVGLPIPVAGLLIMASALWRPQPWMGVLVALAVSALMVSTLPIPTLQAVAGALDSRDRPHRPASLRWHRSRRDLNRRGDRRRRRPAAAAGPDPALLEPRRR